MRAPSRQLIPTGKFLSAIGLGVLIPILMQLIAYLLDPHFLLPWAYVLSPFICGFTASVVFGTSSQGGWGHTLILGFLTFPAYFSVLFVWAYFIGLGGHRGINPALGLILVSVVPPYFLIAIVMSIIGAVLGRMIAYACEG